MNIKSLTLIFASAFLALFLLSCSPSPKLTLETLPSQADFVKLSQNRQKEICQFVFDLPFPEISSYLEKLYQDELGTEDGFAIHASSFYQDKVSLLGNKKPLQNVYGKLTLSTTFDLDHYQEAEDAAKEWYTDKIAPIIPKNLVASFIINTVAVEFMDPRNHRTVTFDTDPIPTERNGNYGLEFLIQTEAELDAQAYILKFFQAYGEVYLTKLGQVAEANTLLIEIFIPEYKGGEPLKTLADNLASGLVADKKAAKYLAAEGFTRMNITIDSPVTEKAPLSFEISID